MREDFEMLSDKRFEEIASMNMPLAEDGGGFSVDIYLVKNAIKQALKQGVSEEQAKIIFWLRKYALDALDNIDTASILNTAALDLEVEFFKEKGGTRAEYSKERWGKHVPEFFKKRGL